MPLIQWLNRLLGARRQADHPAAMRIEDFHAAPRVFQDRREELLWALSEAKITEGHIMEFGVWEGGSINFLAKAHRDLTFWGFDSFEGLPEKWVRTKSGQAYDTGHFAVEKLPNVWPNVQLVKGFFDASLQPWLEQHPGPVRLAHIDCDLYGGAKYVLDTLNPRLVPGSIIVFDELCDWQDSGVYDNWESGEWKALNEWLVEKQRKVEILSRDVCYSAVVRVEV